MARGRSGAGLRDIRTLFSVGTIGGLNDRQLLERFKARRGETAELAFATLVERHGPMVLRVCRGILRDPGDVDDAFQATFLVLARKQAGSLWVRDSIGPWLHGVACRVATRARSDSARRRRHERRAAERTPTIVREQGWDDLGLVLHEEVDRLPSHFRTPIVLCDLEGLTQEQAAGQLGWPLGTVRSRLARGRDRLRERLERRGATPSAGVLATRLAQESLVVPRLLVEVTVRTATFEPAPAVAALTRQVLSALALGRLSQVVVILLAFGLATASAVSLALRGTAIAGVGQVFRTAMPSAANNAPVRSEAERVAERVLKAGSDLFDAKQAEALAKTYTEDAEIHLVDKGQGQYRDGATRGRPEIEKFYRKNFKNAGTIDSENTVEFARFVAPDLLTIHGRFRPNVGEKEIPFIQIRVKQGDMWLLSKLWLFLAPKEP